MITLYHGLASTCSKKVRLALYEKGLEFESRLVNLQAFEQHDPAYLKLNPNGVVPTLVHDGRALIESTIIIEYIDEAWLEPALSPPDPHGRAAMRIWTKWSDEHAYQAVYVPTWDRVSRPVASKWSDHELDRRLARVPTAERRERWRAAAREGFSEDEFAAAAAEMHLTLGKLDDALSGGGPWLLGGFYSLADIAMVPFVDRIINLEPDMVAGGANGAGPALLARERGRPASEAAFFIEGQDCRRAALRQAR
ncbi:MAG: glutathione S-transferase family protein, partial [Alphaproteobacteria bacterium]|nr:glutathione S-transferase family protein [Alphaproteobacteria bacterium]